LYIGDAPRLQDIDLFPQYTTQDGCTPSRTRYGGENLELGCRRERQKNSMKRTRLILERGTRARERENIKRRGKKRDNYACYLS